LSSSSIYATTPPGAAQADIGNSLLELWKSCLVSFHIKQPHHANKILTVGSGFILSARSRLYIATASHVLDDYATGMGIGAFVGGEFVSLDGVACLHQENEDCAFLPPPMSLAGKSCKPLVMGKRDDAIPTSSFMTFGYPETRNRFDVRNKNQSFNVLSIMFHNFHYDADEGNIEFDYDPKTVYAEPGSAIKAPVFLKGMSGAPVVQLLVVKATNTVALRPVGIFKEWRQGSTKRLIAHCFPDFSKDL